MAIEILEAADSPEISLKALKRRFILRGTESEYEAHAALMEYTDHEEAVNGLTLYRNGVAAVIVPKSRDLWTCSADWGLEDADAANPQYRSSAIQFDTSGASTRIQTSLATKRVYRASGVSSIPNFGGGIGYNGESFDGADIVIPQFAWSETHTFNLASITWGYVRALANCTGRTNAGAFRGFAAGEVLFLGASGGNAKNDSQADIQFRFAASPNVDGLAVGGISSISKGGWEYLWVLYEPSETDGRRCKRPIGAYVEQVYAPANFGILGI